MWRGTPAAVVKAAQQAIADAGQHVGFILGSGCEVPMDAPRDHVTAMIETAHRKCSWSLSQAADQSPVESC
ncbi:MAG: uroporphyrinogen decarboxylase family protein [Verrucomicrobiia bacterium]